MDAFEFNKIAGAVLGSALVAFVIGELGDILTEPEELSAHAYAIAPEGTGEETATASAEPAEEAPLSTLLAEADAAEGEKVAKKCAACHTFESGGPNRVGPNLWDVVGKDIGSAGGFGFSPALQGLEGEWTFEKLNEFVNNPKDFAPGTKMTFAGIKKPEQRADLLLYLRSLSASPKELPR